MQDRDAANDCVDLGATRETRLDVGRPSQCLSWTHGRFGTSYPDGSLDVYAAKRSELDVSLPSRSAGMSDVISSWVTELADAA